MINAILDQFLDNGWANEAEIFYKDHIYFLECDLLKDGRYHFFFRKWKVRVVDDEYYVCLLSKDNDLIDYDDSFEIKSSSRIQSRKERLSGKAIKNSLGMNGIGIPI